jgi:hypothetical protein
LNTLWDIAKKVSQLTKKIAWKRWEQFSLSHAAGRRGPHHVGIGIAIEARPSAAGQLDLDARRWTFNDGRGR